MRKTYLVMTSKNAKVALFAILATAMILPFSYANAEKQDPIYDPVTYKYIDELVAETGKTVKTKTVDGVTMKVTTNVQKHDTNDSKWKVKVTIKLGDEKTKQVFKITKNPDNTYKLVNKKAGVNQVFTNAIPDDVVIGGGRGSSDTFGAQITLYDKEYGTPHTLKLYDSYGGCAMFNEGVMQATIRPSTIDVTWEGSPFYMHWCFVPHEFDHIQVQYGTTVVTLDTQADRRSSHIFTNAHGGTAWYSVGVDFVYGSW